MMHAMAKMEAEELAASRRYIYLRGNSTRFARKQMTPKF